MQRSALNADGVKGIVTDRAALERMACPGRVFKVRHLFLLADPAARRKAGGWRRDLLKFIGRVKDRGAHIKDVDMQLTTEKPSHCTGMLAAAFEQLASNGRTIHLSKKRSGRKPLVFSPDEMNRAEKVWINVTRYPTEADAAEALGAINKKFSAARARRLWGSRKYTQSR